MQLYPIGQVSLRGEQNCLWFSPKRQAWWWPHEFWINFRLCSTNYLDQQKRIRVSTVVALGWRERLRSNRDDTEGSSKPCKRIRVDIWINYFKIICEWVTTQWRSTRWIRIFEWFKKLKCSFSRMLEYWSGNLECAMVESVSRSMIAEHLCLKSGFPASFSKCRHLPSFPL